MQKIPIKVTIFSILGVLSGLLILFGQCRVVKEKADTNLLVQDELQCGVDSSLLMNDSAITKVYPDISLILKQKERLVLSDAQLQKLTDLARECFEACELHKSMIQMREIQLRQKYYKKEAFSLQKMAPELNEIEKMRKLRLQEHHQRLKIALRSLSRQQDRQWQDFLSKQKTLFKLPPVVP